MLNTTEIEMIYAIIMDASENKRNQNNIHTSNIYANLADKFQDEYSTDDTELEYQDMLNHSRPSDESENEVIEAIETNKLIAISEDIYNHLSIVLSKNIVSKDGYITSLNFIDYSVQFVVCMDSTVNVLVETKTKPTIGVKYNYKLNQVLNFDNIKVRKIISSIYEIERP